MLSCISTFSLILGLDTQFPLLTLVISLQVSYTNVAKKAKFTSEASFRNDTVLCAIISCTTIKTRNHLGNKEASCYLIIKWLLLTRKAVSLFSLWKTKGHFRYLIYKFQIVVFNSWGHASIHELLRGLGYAN